MIINYEWVSLLLTLVRFCLAKVKGWVRSGEAALLCKVLLLVFGKVSPWKSESESLEKWGFWA